MGRGLGELFKGYHDVLHIKDKFGTGSLSDEEWIERLGAEGNWCVLTGDRRIATKRPSRTAFLAAGLIGFFPGKAYLSLPFERQMARLLYVWPTMVTLSAAMTNGCFEIGMKGERLKSI